MVDGFYLAISWHNSWFFESKFGLKIEFVKDFI